jgi:hypothetical protein
MLSGDEVLRDVLYNGNPDYEKGAIVTRAAPSFIRFGNFQILASRKDFKNLKLLADYTIKHFYPEITITGKDGKYKYRIYNIHIKQTIKRDKEYPSTEDMSIDEAYRQTQKFGLKKVTRRLCDKMVYRFNSSIETLKTYMAKKQPLSKDDF